jgi:hypothetical protein
MNDKGKKTAGMSAVKTITTTYHEQKIGNTLYRVTGVFKGEFELGKALEDLTIRKILREKNIAVTLKG